MSPSRFFRKLSRAAGRDEHDCELREEMQQHLQMKIEDNLAAGMSASEARQAALREFGNPAVLREESADAWSLPFETIWLDVKYAARALRKSPGYTAVALLTLALGIGANAAIFSILRGVLLQPLPFSHPDRLVRIDETGKGAEFDGFALNGVSPPDFWNYKERNHSFENVAVYSRNSALVKIGGQAERVHEVDVSRELFPVLGRRPLLGRNFTADEEPPDPEAQKQQTQYHVAVLGWNFWQHRFQGDAQVLGRTFNVNGSTYTVIGVMPPDFDFPTDGETDVFLPLGVTHDAKMQGARYLDMIGRLKPGITPEQAKADLEVIAAQQKPFRWLVVITGLTDSIVRKVRTPLWVLAGAVGFVLLIVAANLAGLALSRVAARQRDAAVRLALGAGRWRLARGMFAEAGLLAVMGAGGGLVLAHFALRALLAIAPPSLPRVHEVAINAPVVWFTAAATVVTGLLFGMAPAWRAGKAEINQAMKEGGPTLAGARQPLRSAIVAFEVVLAVVLLVGAGLMFRTMAKLRAVNPGFDPQHVLTAEILLPEKLYATQVEQRAFMNSLLPRLAAIPGAESVAATTNLPMTGTDMVFHLVFSNDKTGVVERSIVGGFRSITPDYFRVMRVPLVSGREFTDADNESSLPVGIVNESMVRHMWPNENPLGKKLPNGFTKGGVTIVGVVGDMRFNGFDSEPKPELFVPYAQKSWAFMRLVIRTSGDPLALSAALAQQVRRVDAGQSVDKVRPMEEVLRNSTAERNFYMLLLTIFAALALGLAAVGVFGVVSYAVTQRTHEIGVRMAFGASAAQIAGMVLRKGLLPALLGLVGGMAGAMALTRVLRNLLFGISDTDPLTFAAVALVLLAAAVLACWLPARRATRVSPMAALRYE